LDNFLHLPVLKDNQLDLRYWLLEIVLCLHQMLFA
jgi:hypothetical protein